MKINDLIEKGRTIQDDRANAELRAAEAKRRAREERIKVVDRLMFDPSPLGYRRPTSSHDFLPGSIAYDARYARMRLLDSDSIILPSFRVERWTIERLSDDMMKLPIYRKYGTTHQLIAWIEGEDSLDDSYPLADLVNGQAWIKV